jgi:proteasome accessory factor B
MTNITRMRIERLVLLDQAIRENKFPNCSSFAKALAERFGYDKAHDRRTILRDINWLKDMHHAPVEWSSERRGYFYSDPAWQMPSSIRLTELELLHLLLAGQLVAVHRDTPLAKSLTGLYEKLSMILTEAVNVDPLLLKQQVSILPAPTRSVNPKTWSIVFHALRNREVISIIYANLRTMTPENREIEPIHLANVDGEWYVVAFCRNRQALRYFALGRISKLRGTRKYFEPHDEFDPDSFFEHRFGRFIGGENIKPYDVVIRFEKKASFWVMEREWHPDQALHTQKDGRLILKLPMPSLGEARRWVMGWGGLAEVLEPAELRELITVEVKTLAQKYDAATTVIRKRKAVK